HAEGIRKAIRDINDQFRKVAETRTEYKAGAGIPRDELARLVKELEAQMKAAAKNLEFEKAARLRDQIAELKKGLGEPFFSGRRRGGHKGRIRRSPSRV
ncbi:MAG: hypothetical protein C4303_07690, partial [candidate division GAL15 bacterium]